MKKFSSTWILFVAVLAIGGYAYFVEYKGGNEKKELEEKGAKLIKIEQDQFKAFDLITSQQNVRIVKSVNGWDLERPVADRADNATINNLVSSFANEKIEEIVEEGDAINWQTYGLDQTTSEFLAESESGQKISLKIGKKSFDSRLYARIGDEKKVLLISSTWDVHLSKLPRDLRNRYFYRGDNITESGKLHLNYRDLKNSSGELTLEKTNGTWIWKQNPTDFPLKSDAIDGYFNSIRNFRGDEFVAEDKLKDLAKFGLNKPSLVLKVSKDDKTWELQATKAKGSEAFATSTDMTSIMQTSAAALEDLLKKGEDLINRAAPFKFEATKVEQLIVKSQATQVQSKKKAGVWEGQNLPDGKQIDIEKIQTLLTTLKETEFAELLKGPAASADAALKNKTHFLTLLDDKDAVVFELVWGGEVKIKRISETGTAGDKASANSKTEDVPYYFMRSSLFKTPFLMPKKIVDGWDFASLVKDKSSPELKAK